MMAALRQAQGGRVLVGLDEGERFSAAATRLAGLAGDLLGWRPDEFWAATPEELGCVLAALTGDARGDAPPDAAVMARLMERFPDG